MGTVISKNSIPLTAVFKFSMGSPAKPENTTIRAPIPKKTANFSGSRLRLCSCVSH